MFVREGECLIHLFSLLPAILIKLEEQVLPVGIKFKS
jgi:hypothetical protein